MKRARTGTKFEKQRVSHTGAPKGLIRADAISTICKIDPPVKNKSQMFARCAKPHSLNIKWKNLECAWGLSTPRGTKL